MKLRKCNCGGKPIMYFGDYGDDLRHVYCVKCEIATVSFADGNRAARNWNYLARNNKLKSKRINHEKNNT